MTAMIGLVIYADDLFDDAVVTHADLDHDEGATLHLRHRDTGELRVETIDPTRYVRVRIENDYECSRHSEHWAVVPMPAEGQDPQEWLADVAFDYGGDGHPCGAREGAIYEAHVLVAPRCSDLVGMSAETG